MKKILHIITGIGSGGAENILINLINMDGNNSHTVISLKEENLFKTPYNLQNINIIYLNVNKFNFILKFFFLIYLIKKNNPKVVQTWMYHADFFGGLAAKIAGCNAIFWNLRNSTLDKKTKILTKIIYKINIFLSYFVPNKIISCSMSAANSHLATGYKNNFSIIHNGLNFKSYKIDNKFNKKSIHILPNDIFVIICVGRWHHQKDYPTLFKSLKILKNKFMFSKWKILLVGSNFDKSNKELIKLIKSNNLASQVILLGSKVHMHNYYQNADITILTSSYGEAFPNVISESMACGTPCIATDVGETRTIINKFGWIVEIKNPFKVSECIYEAYKLKKNKIKWRTLKINCNKHIKYRFGINKMINKYNLLWSKK